MNDTSDPAEIEQELAQTRARLGNHLDELSRRLSPGQLLDEGLGYLRTGQGAAFARNLGAQVRDNPLPVTLAGIGIAWLAAAGSLRGGGVRESRALVPYEGSQAGWQDQPDSTWARARRAGEAVTRSAGETEAAFGERIAQAQAAALGVVREAQETAAAFIDRVQAAFETARSQARSSMNGARDTAGRWRESVRSGARQGSAAVGGWVDSGREYASRAGDYAARAGNYASDASDRAARTGANLASAMADNPVVLGAVGLVAGAVLGALLPRTRQEEAYFGGAAGKVANSAREMAGDLVERGAKVADAAMAAGYQAARDSSAEEQRDADDRRDVRQVYERPAEAGAQRATGRPGNGDDRPSV